MGGDVDVAADPERARAGGVGGAECVGEGGAVHAPADALAVAAWGGKGNAGCGKERRKDAPMQRNWGQGRALGMGGQAGARTQWLQSGQGPKTHMST